MKQPIRVLTAAERVDWLRLIRTENVGPITFRALLTRFGSAAAAIDALPDLARRGGRTQPIRVWPKSAAERELSAIDKLGARLIGLNEPDYPELLRIVDDAPPMLAVRGNSHILKHPMVAMVGARNASLNGRRFAERLAGELGRSGYVVASGLARGIDGAAHQGALATGTVAAMAGGIDVVYPPEHADLYERLVAEGVAISECAPGLQPQARHFPRRNRLIAGLALGVVVVEAAPRSGSLITARLAAEQGREVFAVPGSPLDPRAQGCNQLIRSGATLVQTADDILEGLAAMNQRPLSEPEGDLFSPPRARAEPGQDLDTARAAILESLSPTPTPVDELVRGCGLTAAVVATVVLELELAGRVERQPGNRICLVE